MKYNYFYEWNNLTIDFTIERRWFRMKIFYDSMSLYSHDSKYNLHFLSNYPRNKEYMQRILYQEYMNKIDSNHHQWIWIQKLFSIIVNFLVKYHRTIVVNATGV